MTATATVEAIVPATVAEPLIVTRRLSKVFGNGETRVAAVSDVDLQLGRGEIVLVMGPSGSGKTTLLSMLGGLLRPTAGEILVDGVDLAALDEARLPPFRAETFGFIFQDFNLIASLSARENVEVALNIAAHRGRDARERRRCSRCSASGTASTSRSRSCGAAKSSASRSPAPSPTGRR